MTERRNMTKQSIRPKIGRPATGVTPLVALRFPSDRIKEIDSWADKNGISRSEAIRRLVELGLKGKADDQAEAVFRATGCGRAQATGSPPAFIEADDIGQPSRARIPCKPQTP